MRRNLQKPWFLFALLTSVVIGVGDFFLNESVEAHNVYTATLGIYLSQLILGLGLVAFMYKRFRRELRGLVHNRAYLWSGLPASLAMSLGAIAFYKAFDHGPASLVSPMSSVSPIFAVAFAHVWLKERVNTVQFLLVHRYRWLGGGAKSITFSLTISRLNKHIEPSCTFYSS